MPAEPTAEGDLLEVVRDLARGGHLDLGGPVRGRRRLVGIEPAGLADRGRRRVRRATAVRPRARVPGTEPAVRGAPARRVRGRVGRPRRGHRRPDHRRRRRRAAVAHHDGLPGRGHPRGLRRRVADARQRRRAGRVLRPDRRVRRSRRRARRGVPVGRAGAGRVRDERHGARTRWPRPRPRMPAPKPRRRRTTTRTNRPRDDAARRRGTGRESGDPAGPVAAGVSRPGAGERVACRPVRPRPARRLLRDDPAPAVLAQHGRRRDRHRDHPFPGHRTGDGLVHAAAAGRRDRPARSARAAVRGGSAEPAPAARRRRARAWPGSGCWPTRRSGTGAG